MSEPNDPPAAPLRGTRSASRPNDMNRSTHSRSNRSPFSFLFLPPRGFGSFGFTISSISLSVSLLPAGSTYLRRFVARRLLVLNIVSPFVGQPSFPVCVRHVGHLNS